jgi:hypothetical protein
MLLRTRSYPRAGFLGNPSDGYFGKTVAFAFTDFCVDLDLYESPEIEFLPGDVNDNARMVYQARRTGASADFADSGGAIVGTHKDDAIYEALKSRLSTIGYATIPPTIAPAAYCGGGMGCRRAPPNDRGRGSLRVP